MTTTRKDRREFLKSSLSTAAIAASAWPRVSATTQQTSQQPAGPARLRFSVIGLNHGHINSQVESVVRGGGELISFFATEPDLIAAFAKRWTILVRSRKSRAFIAKLAHAIFRPPRYLFSEACY